MSKVFDRIAIKLVSWVVFFSLLLAIISTFAQVYFDYRQDKKRIAETLVNIAWQQLPCVTKGDLADDPKIGDSLLGNLVLSSGIAYAAVTINERVVWQQGHPTGKGASAKYFLFSDACENPPFGTLEVMADTKPVLNLALRSLKMLFSNGLKIFLVAGFTFLMFQYLVTRHLESLAQQIHLLDVSKPGAPLKLERNSRVQHDELDEVVLGLNTMQDRARQAYESLARNEQRLLLFFDSTEEAIIGVDCDSVCSFANDACLKMLGLSDYEDIIGKGLHELFVHSVLSNKTDVTEEGVVCQVLKQGRALQCEDGFITMSDDRRLFTALRAYPVFKKGIVSGALVFINDNSEKRKLLRERELLSEAIEQVPVMIVIAGSNRTIQYVNAGLERLTGFSREELLGRPVTFFVGNSLEDSGRNAAIEARLQAGKQWEGVLETQSKSGKPLKFYSVISPVFDDQNRMVNTISVSREVSYEVALHNELINAKKMEAVNRLSSSFAHEFGNPLFGVRSVLRDITDRVELAEEDKSLLELAYKECERMRKMVQEFQSLYRESTSVDELQTVNKIMIAVLEAAGPLLAMHSVTYTLQLIEETNEVIANTAKLSLVLRKIVVNAIEAMSAKGGILQIGSFLQDDFLVISIGDAGRGIKKEYHELIFEPFFSTKPVVEGAGLGLSVAYGTMKSLGGKITFTSEEGKGTLFHIHLPLE